MFEYFSDQAIKAVMLSQEEARRLGHNFVGTEQLLLGIIGEGTSIAAKVLSDQNLNLDNTRREIESIIGRGSGFMPPEIPFTPRAKRVFESAMKEARQLGNNYIAPEHILLGLLQDEEGVAAKVLENFGIERRQLRTELIKNLGEEVPASAGGNSRSQSRKTATLDEFSTNLTQLAAQGKLDPIVGRDREIERVIQILGRRTKNNPVLIGEPGVGKTAIAEGLAQRIINGNVPELLENRQVVSLEMGTLVAGTRFRGEFEERLKKIVQEIKANGNIILLIDEIHTLVGAGAIEGTMDAANMLKPALARGELQCIGATTLDEYRKYIERDAALERRFQPVMVGEPSVEETIEILFGLRSAYEQHHRLTISDEAVLAAAKLSHRYISDRFLPDKAIDLIDEAGSRVRVMHSKLPPEVRDLKVELSDIVKQKDVAVQVQDFDKAGELRDRELKCKDQIEAASQVETSIKTNLIVTEEDIADVLSAWTGIPVTKMTESESYKLMHMEDTLHQRLIGQHEAVSAVSRAIRRARVGLKNPNRPIASFIFSGPTGVGKTELTKALAYYFFGSMEAMIRLDMSEFMERHTVSKLIGSPPGFVGYDEGGQLTEAVRRRPYTVILFDEIEKAHPDVFNMLLQILEDGRLTDAKGRTVSFKNTLIIMTSNIGSKVIEKGGGGLGFEFEQSQEEAQYTRIRNLVNEELKQYFRPEFINRLDEIIVFRKLTKDEVKQIADILLEEVFARLRDKEIVLEVSDRFKDHIVEVGYDPNYGARPLRRAIMNLLEDVLAETMLSGTLKPGDQALVDLDDDGQVKVLTGEERLRRLPEYATTNG
ncbi:MAG: ATP-dependent Clp protease ATP-binding subunit [Limnospira sp. PMC 1291.21]|uniref:ATP-dependent Clp protease ATP-binding subunit n=1 Tax=Limnospira fusiformis PMC 851.14 TaxID=2219512 RepID=A0ABU9EFN1_LIMFS|nr:MULTISPECIES: ATP-dependent Clp protease ATP-binding subunit [Limnospira]RAQ39506.1 ATP-dependent Clp protease ATP-binding subunit [Arthrospira sp. O9.13F]MDT9179587.1 ATP-dependent Clp protease ATP-binding subunit [Limnospira sp. PMC 1238.20]MDT9187399.1 ATP-dependent Clp protease ATP-binding subunit [Limnospira sp. PMC 894.15]MDT9192514.1 ATP-dependent Clp protease ATP-binding subunit [Limnospira sp. PMC 1245.20]MDT9197866.1 ATP-dependent Clp protease ATP-binding subunit [Limnospira sp. P